MKCFQKATVELLTLCFKFGKSYCLQN